MGKGLWEPQLNRDRINDMIQERLETRDTLIGRGGGCSSPTESVGRGESVRETPLRGDEINPGDPRHESYLGTGGSKIEHAAAWVFDPRAGFGHGGVGEKSLQKDYPSCKF